MAQIDGWGALTAVAPSLVAAVAMLITNSQNKWQRSFSDRQQRLATQQLNLSLLDRRIVVLDVVRDVVGRYFTPETDTGSEASLFPVVHEAHAVFSPDLAQRLDDAWVDQVRLNDLKQAQLRSRNPIEREDARTAYEAFRQGYTPALRKIRDDMIAEVRIVA